MTGLVWEKSGSDDQMAHGRAQAYIDDLNRKKFAGYNDWRLPTLEELASLLENKKMDGLYIDPVFDKNQEWCWTADKRIYGGAWYVTFGQGYVYWDDEGYLNYYVRGVHSRTMQVI